MKATKDMTALEVLRSVMGVLQDKEFDSMTQAERSILTTLNIWFDSESDEVVGSGGDYTTCSTCPNRITYEEFGVNGGQCYECNPELIEETDYLEEDDE
jgi:hypothetical protein